MLERIFDFMPSLIVMIFILILIRVINWLSNRLYGAKSKDFDWSFEHFFKMFWLTKGIRTCARAPVLEEMLYRLPIIILFPKLTIYACIGIVISSVLFAVAHWGNFPEEKTSTRLKCLIVPLIIGLLFGFCGVLTQTVWLVVIMHSIWNLLCTSTEYIIFRQKIIDIKNNPERLAQLRDSFYRKENLSPPAENING